MQSFNPVDMWHHMGWLDKGVVALLALMSVYSLWVMIDRFVVFTRAKRLSVSFVAGLRGLMEKYDLEGARRLSKEDSRSPIARVVHEALIEYQAASDVGHRPRASEEAGDLDVVDLVNRAIDRVKEQEIAKLELGLSGLGSISSAAPFIGLFGTVVGIINAFRSMAASGQGGLGAVSAGISEALVTTAAGLLVAIPAVMAYNHFTRTIKSFVVDMNAVSSELLSCVLREACRR